MNINLKNSIYNFLDKYADGKGIQIVRGVSLIHPGNYEPIPVYYVKTGNGINIFQVYYDGFYLKCPLAKTVCDFFSINIDSSCDIIKEWFFNINNINEDDILSLIKKK